MNQQHFYNNVCHSLRTYGNPYGTSIDRGWNWVNPNNPNDRCAIARFVKGNSDMAVMKQLQKIFNTKSLSEVCDIGVIQDTITLFDKYPEYINDKKMLETQLKAMAKLYNFKYTNSTVSELELA